MRILPGVSRRAETNISQDMDKTAQPDNAADISTENHEPGEDYWLTEEDEIDIDELVCVHNEFLRG